MSEKPEVEIIENASSSHSTGTPPLEKTLDSEKGHGQNNSYLPSEDDYVVTMKTWVVVVILSCSYGLSFWVIPAISAVQAQVSTELGNTANAAWFTTVYTMCTAISFMLFGSNSDLFGRRWFIIMGNVLCFVGYIVIGSAKATDAIIAGNALVGMGAGLCQLAAFALPELLPNRLRHIGVLIADTSTWVAVLFGPITGRYAIGHGDRWRWLFYSPAILCAISFLLLVWLYHPPKHPRGIPWMQALKELDYLGAALFTSGATMVFTGVIYTEIISSSDPKVIGLLVGGFGLIIFFALYERFASLKQPLTPPEIFAKDKGREFTFPFIAGIIVNMFFYSVNIAYPTAINVLWTTAETPLSTSLEYTLPSALGLIAGSVLLWIFGLKINHWKLQFIGSFALMTLFGALMALAKPGNKGMIMAFVFLCEAAYGWAQTLSITFIQFGVPQTQLGISGALAGVARWTGGALSTSIYLTILAHVQAKQAASLVPKAAIANGASPATAAALLAALPLGAAAIEKVNGTTTAIIEAAGAAFIQSYVVGLRTICLTSIAFGVVGTICCCLSNDIGPKMNRRIEVFLENDVNAEKNKFH